MAELRPGAGMARSWNGAGLALAAAVLFGASAPVAKLLLDRVDPWLLAGLLYLGSGIGLLIFRMARRAWSSPPAEASLAGADWGWLAGAIVAGGVVAPVLLMAGLAATPASSASLLLNLEGVLTATLAWLVFRENAGRRVVLGMAAIAAGAVVLSWQGGAALGDAFGPLLIAGACLAWAIDNNLTRKLSLADPVEIAMLKGLAAGAVNLGLALLQGAALPGAGVAAVAGIVGLLCYGVSLVLFVLALRQVGTARTGAYFSVAPFVGAALAVAALGEPVGWRFLVAGLLMAYGVWLHLTERHEHVHAHPYLAHAHRHVHDAHHRHAHGPADPPGEPHSHWHEHQPMRHSHRHYPDAHHRHEH
jgi:drug/metabolite transporter (DMT)-like permease